MENWRSKDLSDTSDGSHLVHLSFEGDDGNNTQVERRFVLAEKEKVEVFSCHRRAGKEDRCAGG